MDPFLPLSISNCCTSDFVFKDFSGPLIIWQTFKAAKPRDPVVTKDTPSVGDALLL